MRHHTGGLGHSGDGLVGEVMRVRGGEADPLDAGLAHLAQQLREPRLAVDVAAVGVDVLAQQRDLAHAVRHEPLALADDRLHGAALLAAADIRDDTVRAEVVAAGHDRHPGVEFLGSAAREVAGEPATLLLGVDLDLLSVVGEGLLQERRQAGERARAEDDVGGGDVGADLLAIALRDAAADGDHAFSAGRLRRAHHGGRLTIEALVGVLAHAARHEDDDIGLLRVLDPDAAVLLQEPLDALGVVEVHLASEGFYVIGFSYQRIHATNPRKRRSWARLRLPCQGPGYGERKRRGEWRCGSLLRWRCPRKWGRRRCPAPWG